MAKRVYDLAVRVGEYQKNGETKGRFVSVGSMMVGDDGGHFIMLNRTFNPAGVPPKDLSSDSVLIGCYPPKPKGENGGGKATDSDVPF
jgi:hypothetical protein